MASKKRKRDESVAGASSKTEHCIIHYRDSSSGPLTTLTEERLSKLKEIQKRRLSEPVDSPHRMSYVCLQIPDTVEENHGYHRQCYKRFTSNLERLSSSSTSSSLTETDVCRPRPPRCPSDGSEKFIFNPDCIFCHKTGKKRLNMEAAGQLNQHHDLNMMEVQPFSKLQRNEKILRCCEGSRVMTFMPVRLNTTGVAELSTQETRRRGAAVTLKLCLSRP